MEFLKNAAQWRKWRKLYGGRVAMLPPTRYPCAAMVLAACDGKRIASADYLYREDLEELAEKFIGCPDDVTIAQVSNG